jgi:hypothetical protein
VYGLAAPRRLDGCSLYSPPVNDEFNWWLLIVGLVIGAGLVWLILADSARRDADVSARERAGEARWIAEELGRAGRPISDQEVADVLDLHTAYLAGPPPDEPAAVPTAPESPPARPESASAPAPAASATAPEPATVVTTDAAWPTPSAAAGSTLPRRSTISQPAGQPRGDGDGLPV